MKSGNYKISYWAVSISLILLFTFIPYLGYWKFGVFNLTLMGILMSLLSYFWIYEKMCKNFLAGFLAGFFFGLSSFLNAWIFPGPSAIIMQNPLFSIIPRILLGAFSGLLLLLFFKKNLSWTIIWSFLVISANAFLTLGFINFIGPIIFYNSNLVKISWMILLTNYLPELILGCIIIPSGVRVINKMYN